METIVLVVGIICWAIVALGLLAQLWVPYVIVLIDHLRGKNEQPTNTNSTFKR